MPQAINESKDATTGVVTQTVIAWTAETLKAQLAEWRYEVEIAGILVGEVYVPTQRDLRGTIVSMKAGTDANPNAVVKYKDPVTGTNHPLDAAQVSRLFQCAFAYVNDCFAAEAALVDRIDAGEDLEAVAADIAWPSRQFDEAPT